LNFEFTANGFEMLPAGHSTCSALMERFGKEQEVPGLLAVQ
jgi:hypothetical protein